ncbi:sensor histidine kinase [Cohnella sp. AR92]|uniref:cache domain-containing sensor histidine kinase n=1 Tax=Cohnella sp. AR92 TaxID=648716 RepID=UPI00131567E7|nr:sensor histidine kinase [Cohnella sp. AR92]
MLRRLTLLLNDMKLRNKMVLSYILFFILPFIIVGFFVVREYRDSALLKAKEQIESSIDRIKIRTNETLDIAINLSSRLSLDSDMEQIATTRYQNRNDVVEAYRDFTTFRMFLDFNPEISQIKLFMDNPTLLNNWEFFPVDAALKNTFWYHSALEHSGLIGWYYFPNETRTRGNLLSLVRSVYFQEERSFGVLAVDVNTEYLNSMLRQENADTLLTDEQGFVVASNRTGMTGKLLKDTSLGAELSDKEPGSYEMTIDGVESKVIIDKLTPDKSYSSLTIITIYSVDSIVKEANRINVLGVQVISIFVVLSILMIYFIFAVITKRLLKFSRQISKVSMGNFNAAIAVDGKDEIGQISRQFNQMVVNIRELMDEVTESHQHASELERKQNEIKLKMLASQINPHFLYNALESIRMKAHLNGEKEISQAVKMLGKLLRKNLEITGQMIALKDEMEISRAYLEIQKFRHEERLNYELRLEPGTEEIRLLPLLVQPLVENSVVHGLERSTDSGTVKISARIDGEHLEVAVADNGIGMSADKLEQLRHALGQQESERIGLHNVHQRLLMTYGEEAGLLLESEPGEGTTIRFRIPLEG